MLHGLLYIYYNIAIDFTLYVKKQTNARLARSYVRITYSYMHIHIQIYIYIYKHTIICIVGILMNIVTLHFILDQKNWLHILSRTITSYLSA